MKSLSKAASKVIKADRLAVSSPYAIDRKTHSPYQENDIAVALELNIVPTEVKAADTEPAEPELAPEEEAVNILAETEEMVKELLAGAREQAELLLDQAKEEAETLVLEARGEVDLLKEQARQCGYRDGYNQALAAAQAEAVAIKKEAQLILQQATEEKAKLIAGTEVEIVKLAMAIAEKVIREDISAKTETVGVMVREALNKANDRETIVVKVNPEDLDYVLGISEELRKEIKGMRKFKVVSDAIISRGGCIVETPNGSVDARIERQLSEIREALMEVS